MSRNPHDELSVVRDHLAKLSDHLGSLLATAHEDVVSDHLLECLLDANLEIWRTRWETNTMVGHVDHKPPVEEGNR